MIRDVLVFTPIFRLEPEAVKGIMGLVWPGPLSLLMQRDNPHEGDGVANHLHQYQRGRDHFLKGDYDAMLVIESDIIPPANTLGHLAALAADVAYGCYMLRAAPAQPVVNVFEKYPKPARNQGESLTVRGLWAQAVRQGIVECSGGGLGCTLIARHVLEAIPFRMGETRTWCDHYWTRDVYQAGYTMKADTTVQCGHKCPDGLVLWPEGAA